MSAKKPSRSRPKPEAHVPVPLDPRDAFFTNLLLMGFDKGQMEDRFNVPFSKDMFALPNKKCFEVVMHFLFEKLNLAMAQDRFRYCWPITDRKQEQAFRKAVNTWLTEIKEEDDQCLPRIVPSMFLSPGGDKFYTFLLHFSCYVVRNVILKEHGVKERQFLLCPQLPSKDVELSGPISGALQAGCVRHRRAFLQRLQTDLILQEEWSSYASEQVKEHRRLTKTIRDLEQRVRGEEGRLMEQARMRGSPSATKRGRSGPLLDAEWDTMAIRRTQRVQRVRKQWETVEACHAAQRQEREVVESVLQGAADRYRVDGAKLKVHVPEKLLRECHSEIEQRNVGNMYQGGKLNLLTLIQLWNISLRLYLENVHEHPLADFESIHAEVVTQVHTHHAHLTNLQALRTSMSQDVLPSLKSSIRSQSRQLEQSHQAPTREHPATPVRNFLGDGLGLLPSTPPVSFEPASLAEASADSLTRPVSKAFRKASPTVNTPEAVSSLLRTVNQVVQRQSNLTQGTPTSTLKLLRDQINRPSKLPKPVPDAAQKKVDRRRVKSAPSGTPARSGSLPHQQQQQQSREEQSTLKLEESTHGGPAVTDQARLQQGLSRTQPRRGPRGSRPGAAGGVKTPHADQTPKNHGKKSDRKAGTGQRRKKTSSAPAPTARSNIFQATRSPVVSASKDPVDSSVSRAHQVLIDQIADAVVGVLNESSELKGLVVDDSPLSSPGPTAASPPLPMGVQDPLSVLDQSAFITRDKLRHSPATTNTPAQISLPIQQHASPDSGPERSSHSPAQQQAAATPLGSSSPELPEDDNDIGDVVHHGLNEGQQSDLLQGMEHAEADMDQAPVGSLIDMSLSSPLYQSQVAQLPISREKQTDFSSLSPAQGSPLEENSVNAHTPGQTNANNSRLGAPSGPSPFKLDFDSFDSPLSEMQEADLVMTPGQARGSPEAEDEQLSLGLVEMDHQLSEIFSTRTPQLSERVRERATRLSQGAVPAGDSPQGERIPLNRDSVKGRLSFTNSASSEESPYKARHKKPASDHEAVVSSLESDSLDAIGILPTRKASAASSRQRGSNGSQKSVTFSDHVEERNISTHSIDTNPYTSSPNGDVFVSNGTPSKSPQFSHLGHDPVAAKTIMGTSSSPHVPVAAVSKEYLNASPDSKNGNGPFAFSPFHLNLDNSSGSGHDDFLLDTSTNVEDFLVRSSPLGTPSTTPKLHSRTQRHTPTAPHGFMLDSPLSHGSPHFPEGSYSSPLTNLSGRQPDDPPSSARDTSLLSDISNLRLVTPGTLPATPTHKDSSLSKSPLFKTTSSSTLDFDLLDEDDSILLPPSPFTQSPSSSVGQLIDI